MRRRKQDREAAGDLGRQPHYHSGRLTMPSCPLLATATPWKPLVSLGDFMSMTSSVPVFP
ncbi:hypothetical protein E2C01_037589 [Portunus trituberculatus]|uniref:Uncharacterized protein n=1 Tax=Portunus trituberculatus TaxID=210409 RepID=A0A5B7F9R4_PORTR|nr:hypothetical protein [Portunus trituberculatus]